LQGGGVSATSAEVTNSKQGNCWSPQNDECDGYIKNYSLIILQGLLDKVKLSLQSLIDDVDLLVAVDKLCRCFQSKIQFLCNIGLPPVELLLLDANE
jgi:hypothetical protein